jgi:hypothetical protein
MPVFDAAPFIDVTRLPMARVGVIREAGGLCRCGVPLAASPAASALNSGSNSNTNFIFFQLQQQ